MALSITSNFAANVAQRNLAKTDMDVTASLTKLSSGTRVVSAKDDAASLAIGSRLRAEVEALSQASVNAGQAGSLLQIADGALSTTADILVRMKSLAVQSSSGQLADSERAVLDAEFQALRSEIDRISNDTEFNGQKLIAGDAAVVTASVGENLGNQGFTIAYDSSVSTDGDAYRLNYDTVTAVAQADTVSIAGTVASGEVGQGEIVLALRVGGRVGGGDITRRRGLGHGDREFLARGVRRDGDDAGRARRHRDRRSRCCRP